MVNISHQILQEKSYRRVTQHVTFVCDLSPLSQAPAVLLRKTVLDVIDLCKANTPRLAKPEEPASAQAATSAAAATAAPSSESAMPPERRESAAGGEEEEEKESSSVPDMSVDGAAAASASPSDSPTVSSPSATVAAVSAFDAPQSAFVTSSSLYPPPTRQRISGDPSRESGVHPSSIEWLWIMGRFLGQAVMEQRLLDLPFSQTLFKQLTANWVGQRNFGSDISCKSATGGMILNVPRVTQQSAPAALVDRCAQIPPPPPSVIQPLLLDILELAPHIARPLFKMLAMSFHRFSPLLFPLPAALQSIDGASIEDLDFDFTLPGHPDIELVPNGANFTVTPANAHIWLWLVARQMVHEGVIIQMHAMQQGLKVCIDTNRLAQFYPHGQTQQTERETAPHPSVDICSCSHFFLLSFSRADCSELEELVSGGGSFGSKLVAWDWSVAKLRSAVKYRQGYTPDSPAITNLLTVMSELTPQQQRQFTRFITGSPSLPGGQIQALNPPLTVVKIEIKQTAAEEAAANVAAVAAATMGASGSHPASAVNLTDSPALAASPTPTTAVPALPSTSAAVAASAPASTSHYVLPSVMTCLHSLKVRSLTHMPRPVHVHWLRVSVAHSCCVCACVGCFSCRTIQRWKSCAKSSSLPSPKATQDSHSRKARLALPLTAHRPSPS